ncbi:hypothetical protein AQUCO_04400034v1 [Aquilegia coerulea]|uniref:Pectinesterase inhibitor domain-containing protein n=1 Tax=Aquilegia coerulea TaxID=218851 RepID=A0A2G5CMS5_AQUCA|nr:hypothetical protein AQUCO_04400034v1 [Aquilegia coerulea]
MKLYKTKRNYYYHSISPTYPQTRMRRFYCYLILFLCLHIFQENTLLANACDVHIIDETCKECAETSPHLSYDFCVSSLQVVVPPDHTLNLQEVDILALELAIANATSTVANIENMLSNKAYDLYSILCLKDCLQLYSDVIPVLNGSIKAIQNRNYYIANIWISAAMDAALTCEDGFKEKEGEVSPLAKEDNDLYQLCDIALVISNLLTSRSSQLRSFVSKVSSMST